MSTMIRLIAVLAIFSVATEGLKLSRQANDTLQPWEVTIVNTHSSSGRPGNPPYSSLYARIFDPNTIYAGVGPWGNISFPPLSANCSVTWNPFTEEPFGWVSPCPDIDFSSGRWTMELQPQNKTGYGPSGTRDFKLRFVLERSLLVLDGGIMRKTFVGVGSFALGENMSIVCGGSGVCNVWLKEDKAVIRQELTESKCVYGTCI